MLIFAIILRVNIRTCLTKICLFGYKKAMSLCPYFQKIVSALIQCIDRLHLAATSAEGQVKVLNPSMLESSYRNCRLDL